MNRARSARLRHLACVITLLACTACHSLERKRFPSEPTAEQAHEAAIELAVVAKETGLQFPEGTQLLAVTRELGMEYWLEAKVMIPEGRVDEFFASSPIERRSLRRRRDHFGLTEPSWVPTQPGGVLSAQAMVGSNALNLGVLDTLENGRVPVLIAFMST